MNFQILEMDRLELQVTDLGEPHCAGSVHVERPCQETEYNTASARGHCECSLNLESAAQLLHYHQLAAEEHQATVSS